MPHKPTQHSRMLLGKIIGTSTGYDLIDDGIQYYNFRPLASGRQWLRYQDCKNENILSVTFYNAEVILWEGENFETGEKIDADWSAFNNLSVGVKVEERS